MRPYWGFIMKNLIFGIAGASGSGKTHLSKLLEKTFSPNCVVINQDNYYLSFDKLTSKERAKLNFDHPSMIDWKLLNKHLALLKSNKPIKLPRYSFSRHLRLKQTRIVYPRSLTIFEGIFALTANIRHIIDFKMFLDTNEEVCMERRINRDILERGRTMKYSLNQYHTTTLPGFLKYISPTRKHADIIVKDNDYLELFTQLGPIVQAGKHNP